MILNQLLRGGSFLPGDRRRNRDVGFQVEAAIGPRRQSSQPNRSISAFHSKTRSTEQQHEEEEIEYHYHYYQNVAITTVQRDLEREREVRTRKMREGILINDSH